LNNIINNELLNSRKFIEYHLVKFCSVFKEVSEIFLFNNIDFRIFDVAIIIDNSPISLNNLKDFVYKNIQNNRLYFVNKILNKCANILYNEKQNIENLFTKNNNQVSIIIR
jgi:hypothetical protein